MTHRALHAAIAALAFLALNAGAAQELRVAPREQTRFTTEGLPKEAGLRATHARTVRLAAPSQQKRVKAPEKGAPMQIGFTRAVAELQAEATTANALAWERLADGAYVAGISVASTDALAVRAALRFEHLPDNAVLRFKGPNDATLFEVTGREVNATLARNRDAGDASDDAKLFWSPVIEGDTVAIEIELPAGADPLDVRVAIPQVSHLVTSAGNTFSTPTTIGRSASCQIDAMCSASSWSNQRNAVAEMIFSDSTGSYLCTGTLVADADLSTNAPYFLSARHCIGSQTIASTLTTYWFYRSSACNSGTPGAYKQLTGGATLLYESTNTDTSFMRLANTPPQGTFFAGWSSGARSVGNAITALHQPKGDLLKISTGSVAGFLTCTAPTNGQFTCNNATASGGTFYEVGWSSGITEGGSSGSGIFLADGTLVGQLYGGSSSCTGSGTDIYGRFDTAYNAALKTWLSPAGTLAISKTGAGSGTVTSSPAGISCGANCSASYPANTSITLTASASPGSIFTGWGGACSGTASTCTIVVNSDTAVTTSFQPTTPMLNVTSDAGGIVTSAPAGINCGPACSATFNYGTAVTLTAAPLAGMEFKGWSGPCTGLGSCTVTMTAPTTLGASFGPPPAADIAITQTASANPVAGKDVVYTLTATNYGPAPASAITLTDTLPAGATFIWASPGCTNAGGTVSCNLGSISVGAAKVKIVVRPAAAGSLTNVATVANTEADPVPANNTASLVVSVSAAPTAVAVQRYRLYSPVTQEHHFTTDANEYNVLGSYVGTWVQEGPAGKVLSGPGSFNGVAAVPYYRLYNTRTRWHHWTSSANEYYTLQQVAEWLGEGVDGYVLPTAAPGTIQLYRLVYPDGRGLHHWTIDPAEYSALIGSFGWVGEGGAGFVIP